MNNTTSIRGDPTIEASSDIPADNAPVNAGPVNATVSVRVSSNQMPTAAYQPASRSRVLGISRATSLISTRETINAPPALAMIVATVVASANHLNQPANCTNAADPTFGVDRSTINVATCRATHCNPSSNQEPNALKNPVDATDATSPAALVTQSIGLTEIASITTASGGQPETNWTMPDAPPTINRAITARDNAPFISGESPPPRPWSPDHTSQPAARSTPTIEINEVHLIIPKTVDTFASSPGGAWGAGSGIACPGNIASTCNLTNSVIMSTSNWFATTSMVVLTR